MYNQGDILLIPIPFSDLKTNKKRPVLVISNSFYNEKTEDIIVAAITSNLSEKEFSLLIYNEDMKEGTLKTASLIRIDKIYTLSKSIVIKKFGMLKPEVVEKAKEKLYDLFSNWYYSKSKEIASGRRTQVRMTTCVISTGILRYSSLNRIDILVKNQIHCFPFWNFQSI